MRIASFAVVLTIATAWSVLCFAEDAGLTLPPPPTAHEHPSQPPLTCFKTIYPADACLVVGRQLVDYSYPEFNVIDLNGAWASQGQTYPAMYIYVYGEGNSISVDLSLVNRPDGFGNIIDPKTLSVVFPDDRDYTAVIESPTTIRWSNGTVWTKL